MAIFLNTPKLNYWINRLIKESQKELILIVPYIQTSQNIFNALQEVDKRNVETTLIYRENKLSHQEKRKLTSLKNINLLHHPNIHCKCYFNGELIIICSMNLYEYSEKNNREMGVLFHSEDLEGKEGDFVSCDDTNLFQDSIFEIREIINGSILEKISPKKKEAPFVIEIVKTEEEIAIEKAQRINKYFLNKKFKPDQDSYDCWISVCRNYHDKVDVLFEERRVSFEINQPEEILKQIFDKWMKDYNEFEFKGFKYYWNYYNSPIYLYKDNSFPWDDITEYKIYYKKIKQGIDNVIRKYRKVSGK